MIDDPKLSKENLKLLQETFKDLYQFTRVSNCLSPSNSFFFNFLLCNQFVLCCECILQTLAKRSQEKSDKLKFIEDSHRQLQEKDHRISQEIYKRVELRNELEELKREQTRETWLLQKDISNLEKERAELLEKNKSISRAHKGKLLI